MMNLQHGVIFMVIGSFIVQYVMMSAIMANSYVNITNSMGKLYLSSLLITFNELILIKLLAALYLYLYNSI